LTDRTVKQLYKVSWLIRPLIAIGTQPLQISNKLVMAVRLAQPGFLGFTCGCQAAVLKFSGVHLRLPSCCA